MNTRQYIDMSSKMFVVGSSPWELDLHKTNISRDFNFEYFTLIRVTSEYVV